MANRLGVYLLALGVFGATGCASSSSSSSSKAQSAEAEAVVQSITIGDNCEAPEETVVAEGDKVEFSAPANYRVVLDEKSAQTGAYFEGESSGTCSSSASHPHKYDVPKNGKTKTCKIHKGSAAHDQTWAYAVTLFDDAGQHCHTDPNICVVKCN